MNQTQEYKPTSVSPVLVFESSISADVTIPQSSGRRGPPLSQDQPRPVPKSVRADGLVERHESKMEPHSKTPGSDSLNISSLATSVASRTTGHNYISHSSKGLAEFYADGKEYTYRTPDVHWPDLIEDNSGAVTAPELGDPFLSDISEDSPENKTLKELLQQWTPLELKG